MNGLQIDHLASNEFLTDSYFNNTLERKWMYLFANNIAFKRHVNNAIRVKKPSDKRLKVWLEKVITADQCSHLFIENFDAESSDGIYITGLCELYNVTLVNLNVGDSSVTNVIQGPWQ